MLKSIVRHSIGLVAGASLACWSASGALAEVKQVRIADQFGLNYLPLQVMVAQKLLQKHATRLGLGELEVSLVKLGSGAAVNDALIAGSIDFAAGGTGPLLTLWDKTRGTLDVRAIGSLVSLPMLLNTNRAELKSIKDFTEKDRIAVPAVKVSIQAVVLQMAGKKLFNNPGHFDAMQVSMRHPDATAALLSGQSVITAHFGVPPFTHMQAKKEGIRTIASSYDIVGGKHSQILMYNTKKFRDDNPKTSQAFYAALEEAMQLIAKDKKTAIEIYLSSTSAKEDPALIKAILDDPDVEYTTTPHRLMDFANFMHELGRLKNKPASWKDVFWENAHHLPGS